MWQDSFDYELQKTKWYIPKKEEEVNLLAVRTQGAGQWSSFRTQEAVSHDG